jgi:signal transduction histidine kinase
VPRTSHWLRVFVALLLAVLPPILLLVGVLLLTESILRDMDPNLVAVTVVAGTITWAAVVAIVYSRAIADDLRSMLTLAQRGEGSANPDLGMAHQQLGAALDERNRQIATLAREASAIPIDDDPRVVVTSLISAVRSVTSDPTWRAAVLTSEDSELLPPGVYVDTGDGEAPDPIGDLERWASVASADQAACRVDGPWGAFAVIQISVSDRLGGILYAPWAGRPEPTAAELAILSLVGQQAGTAIEHSLLYARVRRQADELDRLAHIQADFLRGVTHDLQTPLTSIGALASELRADAQLPASAGDDLEMIAHQAERLRRMVSQLLVASRIEAGVIAPRIEVFAVPPLVERTWAALRAARPFDLVVSGEPHLAVGDPDRFEQVLWALLDNAVKYSPGGSPIVVHLEPSGAQLAVRVEDRGTGMDAETQALAFDQFYRSAQARRLAPDGSGVGLYAARGLVNAMGGSIDVESTLGAGTTVIVRLPAEVSGSGD